jgi:hypothetical protein
METAIQLTEDEFDARFPLLRNHLNPNATWGFDGAGCLFETYGAELEFVRQQDERFVWTFLEGDGHHGDTQYVVSGYHFVNRIGYLISTVPVPVGQCMEVALNDYGP